MSLNINARKDYEDLEKNILNKSFRSLFLPFLSFLFSLVFMRIELLMMSFK
jgi:hypothetical protein